eukprot:1808423-Amphidinium_carterae.1
MLVDNGASVVISKECAYLEQGGHRVSMTRKGRLWVLEQLGSVRNRKSVSWSGIVAPLEDAEMVPTEVPQLVEEAAAPAQPLPKAPR